MKRLMIPLVLCLSTLGLSAAEIFLSRPAGGDRLVHEQTYQVLWMRNGEMEPRVNILLMGENLAEAGGRMLEMNGRQGLLVGDSIENHQGPNWFMWTVSGRIPPGEYRLRVITVDERVWGESPIFEIRPPDGREGLPDLEFTGELRVGNQYLTIRAGETVVLTPTELGSPDRLMEVDPGTGRVLNIILPFNMGVRNTGDARSAVCDVRIQATGGVDQITWVGELNPREERMPRGAYVPLRLPMTSKRTFEVVLTLNPEGRMDESDRKNNRFFFILETRNFK
ncbi:MAG: hypothetical protein RB296_09085 [Acidobacteriota bacterium]|jgi:hypothetical protein|nr:hypothetical protein [Acidobacteriota bacterium]